MRFSLCTDALWPGVPAAEAVRRAASLGAAAIEFWGWWDKDLAAIRDACQAEGIEVAAICTRFISLVDASAREAYLKGLAETISAAAFLDCRRIISQVGNAMPGLPREAQRDSLQRGLQEAEGLLEGHPVQLLIEPLNTVRDHVGYYLHSSQEAREILEAVNHPQVGMLFDIYHQAMMGEQVLAEIRASLPLTGHMHAAGVPGRGPLRQGGLDYAALSRAIEDAGYQGLMGMEWMHPAPEAELAYWCARQDNVQ